METNKFDFTIRNTIRNLFNYMQSEIKFNKVSEQKVFVDDLVRIVCLFDDILEEIRWN